jgi:hypothetical protein
MPYTAVDRFMDTLDDFRRGLRGWTKGDHSQYFPVACAHSDKILALYNGSLVSVIRIDGYLGQYFPEQFELLRKRWAKFLRTANQDKSAKGFDLFWSYEYDPEGMEDKTLAYRKRTIDAASRRGLELSKKSAGCMETSAPTKKSFCSSSRTWTRFPRQTIRRH